jgi:hypothetical protein
LPCCSNTSRTARSRISAGYLLCRPIAPILSRLGASGKTGAVQVSAPPVVVSLAFCANAGGWTNSPEANPYLFEFALALAALVAVFHVWCRVRPPPRELLRGYVALAGGVAMFVMLGEVCMGHEFLAPLDGCLIVLEASSLVTATLVLEILLSRRLADHPLLPLLPVVSPRNREGYLP